MHGRSRIVIDPRLPTMPEIGTLGFGRPRRHCSNQVRSAVTCFRRVALKGKLHAGGLAPQDLIDEVAVVHHIAAPRHEVVEDSRDLLTTRNKQRVGGSSYPFQIFYAVTTVRTVRS